MLNNFVCKALYTSLFHYNKFLKPRLWGQNVKLIKFNKYTHTHTNIPVQGINESDGKYPFTHCAYTSHIPIAIKAFLGM